MSDKHLCVAIYLTHDQADEAFSRLQAKGFNLELLSFVGRDSWNDMLGSRNTGKRFSHNGTHGPFWERLWSILPGWGVFWLFEDGPMLVAGPLARAISAAQDEGDGNHNGMRFVESLSRTGIPESNIRAYEAELKKDRILVFIGGTIEDIDKAQAILNETSVINHTVHHGADVRMEAEVDP
jgi:hypothetical protein